MKSTKISHIDCNVYTKIKATVISKTIYVSLTLKYNQQNVFKSVLHIQQATWYFFKPKRLVYSISLVPKSTLCAISHQTYILVHVMRRGLDPAFAIHICVLVSFVFVMGFDLIEFLQWIKLMVIINLSCILLQKLIIGTNL